MKGWGAGRVLLLFAVSKHLGVGTADSNHTARHRGLKARLPGPFAAWGGSLGLALGS